MSLMNGGERTSSGPMIVRELGFSSTYDFDRMADRHRIWVRHAPNSGGAYEKDCVTFELPEGTPTPGLDALGWLLDIVEKKERPVRSLSHGAEVKFENVGATGAKSQED